MAALRMQVLVGREETTGVDVVQSPRQRRAVTSGWSCMSCSADRVWLGEGMPARRPLGAGVLL